MKKMKNEYEGLFNYYRDSYVMVINDRHPFFTSTGMITSYDHTGLVMKSFATQEQFFVQPKDLKITKRI